MDLVRPLGKRTPFSLTIRPNVSYVQTWEIERSLDIDFWIAWFAKNWHWSVYISVGYLVTIFGLQAWMKGRKRLELRKPLFIWNCCLAMCTMLAVLRTGPEVIHVFAQEWSGAGGWWSPWCSRVDTCQTSIFWGIVFLLFKVVELGDTLFIVLRKQPLIFLHWYHHVTVLIFSWYGAKYGRFIPSVARVGAFVNGTAHSFMYTYYVLKSIYSGIPRTVAMFITILQVSEMVIAVVVGVYVFFNNEECLVPPEVFLFGFLLYVSYFVLFANFFFKSYVAPLLRRKEKRN